MWDRGSMLNAAYLKGWDAALLYGNLGDNPYRRDDYRRRWEFGFRHCEATARDTRPGFRREEDAASLVHILARLRS